MEGDPGGFITPDLRIVVRDWRRGGHVREHDRGGGMSVRVRGQADWLQMEEKLGDQGRTE